MTTHGHFLRQVREQFALQPLAHVTPVRPEDLAHLPAPVRRHVERSGAVGRPRVHGFRADWEARMYRKPGQAIRTRAVQYGFVDRPARYFFMHGWMSGLPVRVFHAYADERAHMRVRVAGLVNVVDDSGPVLDRAETVTIMNDLCVLAPATLVDPRFTWEPVDDRTARAAFRNGAHHVTATLFFDEAGDLVDFSSDDRGGRPGDGHRWTTPLRDYRNFGERRVASAGQTIWHYPDRPSFTYGEFVLRDLAYNVAALQGA